MIQGHCTCKKIRYELKTKPMYVHCCHCTWCQRETGTAFALNAMIESDRFILLDGTPEMINTPTLSGKGQKIFRCPHCKVAIWSHYSGAGDKINFVRVGTLDNPSQFPPDMHIFTSTKQPWVVIPDGMNSSEEYYDRKKYWSQESLDRRQVLFGK